MYTVIITDGTTMNKFVAILCILGSFQGTTRSSESFDTAGTSNCDFDDFENCRSVKCEISRDRGVTVCVDGCIDGYQGPYCHRPCAKHCRKCNQFNRTCTECIPGYYGNTCDVPCPAECQQFACHLNGTCSDSMCVRHIYGPFCNLSCNSAYAECDANGKCIACKKGYYGDQCEFRCPVCMDTQNFDTYECKSGCSRDKCRKDDVCNPETALCDTDGRCISCKNGYYGNTCEFPCPVCNEHFNFTTYKCKPGCAGESCSNPPTIAIVAAVVSSCVFLAIGICIMSVICNKRIKKMKKRLAVQKTAYQTEMQEIHHARQQSPSESSVSTDERSPQAVQLTQQTGRCLTTDTNEETGPAQPEDKQENKNTAEVNLPDDKDLKEGTQTETSPLMQNPDSAEPLMAVSLTQKEEKRPAHKVTVNEFKFEMDKLQTTRELVRIEEETKQTVDDDADMMELKMSPGDVLTDLTRLQRENLALRQEMAVMRVEPGDDELVRRHAAVMPELEDEQERRLKAEVQRKMAEGRIEEQMTNVTQFKEENTQLKQENAKLHLAMQNMRPKASGPTAGKHWFQPPDFVCPRLELSEDHLNTEKCQIRDGRLINTPRPGATRNTRGFTRYYGTCNTSPLPRPPDTPAYYEVDARVELREITLWPYILEVGVAVESDRDEEPWLSYSRYPRSSPRCCWAVTVVLCLQHRGKICAQLWCRGEHTECHPVALSPTPGNSADLQYGVMVAGGRAAFLDLSSNTVMAAADVDVDEHLWPMFGLGREDLSGCSVEMAVRSGEDISMTDAKKTLIREAISSQKVS